MDSYMDGCTAIIIEKIVNLRGSLGHRKSCSRRSWGRNERNIVLRNGIPEKMKSLIIEMFITCLFFA